jgi:hypothetical protein
MPHRAPLHQNARLNMPPDNITAFFAEARRSFHAALLGTVLRANDAGIPSNADGSNGVSVAIAKGPEPLRGLDVIHLGGWLRDRLTVLAHALQVKLDPFPHELLDFLQRVGGRHTAWKVRDIGMVLLSFDGQTP